MNDQPDNSPDNSPPEITPLVLYALEVPRATRPVVGADRGVPLHIYDLEPMGLELRIAPFLGQQAGDKVAANVNDELDVDNKLTQSDSDSVTLHLPEGKLSSETINYLTYTVTRGSQNMGTSEPLKVLYNKFRPGKEDTDPGVAGHSRLELLLPDAIKNGVGPDFPVAGAQVCVSYPYCRAYDVIRLNCNGHIVVHTVTSSEAPLPGSDTPVTVCFTVTRADLASGGDAQYFVFSYTVTDQLGNSPTPQSPWSANQLVDVDLAGVRLPAPILREIQNDPTDDPSIIDRDKLAGNPLLVVILTDDNRFQPDDLIEATYTATILGQPDVVVIVPGTVETDEFGQKKRCILQVPNDKVITNSTVKVAFTLKRGVTLIASSKTATAQVIGSDTITLDPPVPAANPVDPLAYPQGLTIQVAFAASQPGELARLIVHNRPNPPTFADLPLDATHQATFNLDARFLGAWHGTTVQFAWALIRGDEEIARSRPLELNVSRIASGDTRLPTPAIAGQLGQELDVTKLVVADLLSIVQWLLQVAGQYVWLRFDGFNSSGAPIFFDVLIGVPHNEAQGLNRPLGQALVDWLKALQHGRIVTITFRVNFGKVADLTQAVTFPLREYTVSAVVDEKPAITSIKGASSGVDISNGGTTVETAVVLTGLASKGQKVDVRDGTVSKGQPTADATGVWSLTVSDLSVDPHSYTATALYGSGQTSEAWTFTVIALVAPSISSIKGSPSGVEIRQGDYTVESTVVLTGMASKGLQVEVLDGTTSKGKPIAHITTGVWTLTVSGLSVGSHRFTVKALYGSIPPSAERQFSIIPPYTRPTIINVVRTDTGAFVPSGSTLPRGVQLRVTGGCYSHPTKSRALLLVGSNNHNGAVELWAGVNSYTINEFGWPVNAGYATYQALDNLSGLYSQTAWGINWV